VARADGHQGSNPGGHSFSFLNISINKKPVFFSEVVTNKKDHPGFKQGGLISWEEDSATYLRESNIIVFLGNL